MAENYSVKAVLSAVDRGFTSTLKSCSNTLDKINNKVSGFSFGLLTGAGQAAFNALTSSVSGLVTEIDSSNAAWKTFEANMAMVYEGVADADKIIGKAKETMQDYATKTVYSASDMATTYAQLAAVGIKNTDKLVTGFGGLAAAAENPQQAMKTLSQQATQMAAKPTVAWQDFKLMLEQTPAGIAAVAKHMNMSTSELVSAVQAGTVKTEDFFNAISEVGNNDAFYDLATQAKTVGQAMDGMTETLSNKLQPAFDVFSKKGISAVDAIANKFDEIEGDKLAGKVSVGLKKAEKYWTRFQTSFEGVWTEIVEAGGAIKSSIEEITGAFGYSKNVDSFGDAMKVVADGIKSVANFAEKHSGAIAKIITMLPKLFIAMKGFNIAKSAATFLMPFASGLMGIMNIAGGGLASKLFGIGKGTEEVGKKSSVSGKKMLTSAKAFMMMGAGVLMVAAGFGILTVSAIALSDAGGLAIGVMVGLAAGIGLVGLGMVAMVKALAPMSKKLEIISPSLLKMGAAVLVVSAGFALLAFSAIALANAGTPAILCMVGMVAAIALLAAGAAALGPMLMASAPGLTAFGTAILMVGAGALLASLGMAVLAEQLPLIAQYGLQGALNITALGGALLVFAAGTAVAGVGCVALGAGLLAVAAGLGLVGAATLVTATGVAALAAGALVLGIGLSICMASITGIAMSLPLVAISALLVVAAFTAMLAVGAGLSAVLLLITASMASVGIAATASGIGIAAFGLAMTTSAVGVLAMAAALKGVNSSMGAIAKNAKSAATSLKSMKSAVKVVESGLDGLGSKAKSAMKGLTSSFDSTASKAKSAGQKTGTGFAQGMKPGFNQAVSFAAVAVSQVSGRLSTGYSSAYSSGAYIGIGFAAGMRSQLGAIRSVAAQMAAAADEAIRQKARIASPSKVTTKLGEWFGEGFVNGIAAMTKDAWDAAINLVTIPTVQMPNLALAYGGELSADYEYSRNAEYHITVVSELDGKEVARSTATYMQSELDKNQARNNRKRGLI